MYLIKPLFACATLMTLTGLTACSKPADKASDTKASNSTSATTTTTTTTSTTATTSPMAGKKVRIATEGAYPPFNFKNPDGSLGGFDVDVAKAVCAQIQADCEMVAQDFDGLIPGLVAKKYDGIIAGMSITPERQQQVDFTAPYFKNTMVWLAPKSGKFNLQAITGLKLGGQRSTTPGAYLQEHYGKNNDIKLYDTYDNAYLDLKAGRVDAVLSEKVPGVEWLKQNGTQFGFVGDEIDNNDNLGMAVRKGDPLKAEFDKGLSAIQANGQLVALEKKYFGDSHGTATTTATTNAVATSTTTTVTTTSTVAETKK